jgi:hypothetical protein
MCEHFGKIKRRHDIYRNTLAREAGDEVALTKGVIHGEETQGSSTLTASFVVGMEFMEKSHTAAIRNMIVM